jgi:hypothetical protein
MSNVEHALVHRWGRLNSYEVKGMVHPSYLLTHHIHYSFSLLHIENIQPHFTVLMLSLGEPLTVATEEDVFRILGLDYRDPKDRDV